MYSLYKYLRGLIIVAISLCIAFQAYAQSEIAIKGTVVASSDRSPLPGVSILLQTTGTPKPLGLTDGDGNFEIKAPANGTLEFRFIS